MAELEAIEEEEDWELDEVLNDVRWNLELDACTGLDLRSLKLDSRDIDIFAEALRSSATVETVDMRRCGFGSLGGLALARIWPGNTSIRQLDVGSCGLGDAGAVALFNAIALARTTIRLEVLAMDSNGIGPQGFLAAGVALASNRSLVRLLLAGNRCDDAGAWQLSEALSRNTTLRDLDLSDNNIGPRGVLALAEALVGSNGTLERLALEGNSPACSPAALEAIELRCDRSRSDRRERMQADAWAAASAVATPRRRGRAAPRMREVLGATGPLAPMPPELLERVRAARDGAYGERVGRLMAAARRQTAAAVKSLLVAGGAHAEEDEDGGGHEGGCPGDERGRGAPAPLDPAGRAMAAGDAFVAAARAALGERPVPPTPPPAAAPAPPAPVPPRARSRSPRVLAAPLLAEAGVRLFGTPGRSARPEEPAHPPPRPAPAPGRRASHPSAPPPLRRRGATGHIAGAGPRPRLRLRPRPRRGEHGGAAGLGAAGLLGPPSSSAAPPLSRASSQRSLPPRRPPPAAPSSPAHRPPPPPPPVPPHRALRPPLRLLRRRRRPRRRRSGGRTPARRSPDALFSSPGRPSPERGAPRAPGRVGQPAALPFSPAPAPCPSPTPAGSPPPASAPPSPPRPRRAAPPPPSQKPSPPSPPEPRAPAARPCPAEPARLRGVPPATSEELSELELRSLPLADLERMLAELERARASPVPRSASPNPGPAANSIPERRYSVTVVTRSLSPFGGIMERAVKASPSASPSASNSVSGTPRRLSCGNSPLRPESAGGGDRDLASPPKLVGEGANPFTGRPGPA
eukprot:tig00021489_g21660.t1